MIIFWHFHSHKNHIKRTLKWFLQLFDWHRRSHHFIFFTQFSHTNNKHRNLYIFCEFFKITKMSFFLFLKGLLKSYFMNFYRSDERSTLSSSLSSFKCFKFCSFILNLDATKAIQLFSIRQCKLFFYISHQ